MKISTNVELIIPLFMDYDAAKFSKNPTTTTVCFTHEFYGGDESNLNYKELHEMSAERLGVHHEWTDTPTPEQLLGMAEALFKDQNL